MIIKYKIKYCDLFIIFNIKRNDYNLLFLYNDFRVFEILYRSVNKKMEMFNYYNQSINIISQVNIMNMKDYLNIVDKNEYDYQKNII